MLHRFVSVCACALMALTLTGCSSEEVTQVAPTESSIKELSIMYGGFVGRNGGRPPRSYDEFKAYVTKNLSTGSSPKTPEQITQILTSPRDQQPFKVVTGTVPVVAPGEQVPVVYEAVGVDGMRAVAFSLGKVELLDDAKLKAAIPQAN
jgi:hypothetical protein